MSNNNANELKVALGVMMHQIKDAVLDMRGLRDTDEVIRIIDRNRDDLIDLIDSKVTLEDSIEFIECDNKELKTFEFMTGRA